MKTLTFCLVVILLSSCSIFKKEYDGNIRITKLDSIVNTIYEEYSPVILPDQRLLLYVSRKPKTVDQGENFNESMVPYGNIYIAVKSDSTDSTFTRINSPVFDNREISTLNSDGNFGAFCISEDGEKIYLTGYNWTGGFGNSDIYSADLKIEYPNVIITNINNLGPEINTENPESNPSISIDNKLLFFVSQRQSKYSIKSTFKELLPGIDKNDLYDQKINNSFDIFYSNFDTKKNIWSLPVRMSKTINTDKTEFSPFICSDNKTLIFVSDGLYPSYGKLDLYYSKLDSTGIWSEPVNFGKPVNSIQDELGMMLSNTGETGYFSSRVVDGYSYVYRNNIYYITLPGMIHKNRIITWYQLTKCDVNIQIIDQMEQVIRTIQITGSKAGYHTYRWDGKDENGKILIEDGYYCKVNINP